MFSGSCNTFFKTCVLLLAFFPATSFSEQSRAETISIAVPALPGFVTSAQDQPPAGPLVDLLREIEKTSGNDFDIIVRPFRRVLAAVEHGSVDIGIFLRSNRRDAIAYPTLQIAKSDVLAVALRDRPLEKPEHFKNMTIGHLRGGVGLPGPYAEQNIEMLDLDSHTQGLKMLSAGRLDAVIIPDFRLRYALKDAGMSLSDLSAPHPVDERFLWMYWSRKSQKVGMMKDFADKVAPTVEQHSKSMPPLF